MTAPPIDVEFARITGDLKHDTRIRDWGFRTVALAILLLIAGLGVDAWLHAKDPTLAEREGVFTFSNGAHTAVFAGIALAVCGILFGLVGDRIYGPKARVRRRWQHRTLQIAAPVAFLVAVVGVGQVAAASSLGKGHSHVDLPPKATKPLTPSMRARLGSELATARNVALRYPTVRDAQMAGMFLAGGFAAGSGAHYVWPTGLGVALGPGVAAASGGMLNAPQGPTKAGFDPAFPTAFLYDGTAQTSRIAGVMYVGLGARPPSGFTGPYDRWHRHSNVCIRRVGGQIVLPLPADRDISEGDCTRVGGTFLSLTVWMVHAWVVPGWDSPQGVFSHANSFLQCRDGKTHIGWCEGSE